MKKTHIAAAILCFSFIFPSIEVSAQTTPPQSIFQSFWSVPKNFFRKLFAPKVIIAPATQIVTAPEKEEVQVATTSVNAKEASKKIVFEKKSASPVKTATASVSVSEKVTPSVSANKESTLKVNVSSGGYVTSNEIKLDCFSLETCTKVLPTAQKIKLTAVPTPGYLLKGWSEAQCAAASECTVILRADMTVYAYFEIVRSDKKVGKILSPSSGDTCYILLGEDKCNLMMTWQSNTGLDMTIKVDHDEYYLATEDHSNFPRLSDADPKDLAQADSQKASGGPVYFTLFVGKHTIAILNHAQDGDLDSVNVSVECAPGLYWDGTKCWEKGAKRLTVFQSQHAVVTSDPAGIKCGYRPERCTLGFSNNAKVTLHALIEDGFVFDGWTGGCTNKELTCTLIMDSDKGVGIRFK